MGAIVKLSAIACGLLFAAGCSAWGSGRPEVRVTDRGIANDGKTSQSAALEALVKSVPDGSDIVFPKGVYYLESRVNVEARTNLVFRGESGARIMLHFTPWGPVAENNSAFSVGRSKDISFENLTFTTDNPPNCSGRVVALDPKNGTYDVKIDDEFPITGWEHFWGTDTFDDEGMPDYAIETYENVTTAEVPDGKGGLRKKMTGTKYEVIGPQLIRVVPPRGKGFDFRRLHVGHRVLYRYIIYGSTVFSFWDAHDVVLRDIEIERCASFGATVSPPSSNFTFERFNMRTPKGSGALYCANADGVHFVGLAGYLRMIDCHFDGLGDDCLNIHGKSGEVKAYDPKTGEIQCICRNTRRQETKLPAGWAKKGDTLVVWDPKTFFEKGKVSLAAYDGHACRGRIVPGDVKVEVGDILANDKDFASVEIRDCTFRNTRARGVLLRSRNMTVENCLFEGFALPGVLITPDVRIWNEIGPTVNAEIRNCTFRKCGMNGSRANLGAIAVKTNDDAGADDGLQAGVHRDIRILDNTFEGCGNSGIFVAATDGVVVKGNTFRNCSIRRYDAKDNRNLYEIRLHHCANTQVSDNETDKSPNYLLDRR